MTKRFDTTEHSASNMYRCVTAAVGLLLFGCGLYLTAAMPHPDWKSGLVGLVLVTLGANGVYAAVRSRPAWISRIGPLP